MDGLHEGRMCWEAWGHPCFMAAQWPETLSYRMICGQVLLMIPSILYAVSKVLARPMRDVQTTRMQFWMIS